MKKVRGLYGLDGKEHEVVDEADFFLDKGFRIAHAGEQAVVARRCEGAFADVFFRHEERATCGLGGVLRSVGEEGLQALLDVGCDVDHERGPDVSIERGVENLVRAMRSGGRTVGVESLDLREAAEEAGFVAERGRGVVVGVTALPVGKDDYTRAEAA